MGRGGFVKGSSSNTVLLPWIPRTHLTSWMPLRIPTKADTHSNNFRTVIPIESGQFCQDLAVDSKGSFSGRGYRLRGVL